MAHFFGIVGGGRGEATRNGHKTTGLHTTAASWEGCVKTSLWYDEETDTDMCEVSLAPWHGAGVSKVLYHGPVSGKSS